MSAPSEYRNRAEAQCQMEQAAALLDSISARIVSLGRDLAEAKHAAESYAAVVKQAPAATQSSLEEVDRLMEEYRFLEAELESVNRFSTAVQRMIVESGRVIPPAGKS